MSNTEQLNTALAGRYAIDRLIGEGGMATVYLARDVRHNRRVALKVLKPDLGAVVGIDRFLSEIQVTANLQHPNLLPLFDSGAADHLLFYVMPYVEGESLRARLEREKQLPVDEAVRLATAVASALDYAHRHGVIHRDLKPENILLHEGQPLVADFGIALAVSNAGGNRITQTGLSLGTPQYMSPEQATGDRAIDGRTDIYSLGALTYEMLTGEAPHTGNTSQAIIARLLTERPRSIRASRPSVPEHVEAAVERALEKLPADRWASPKEFSEALTGARMVTRPTTSTVAASPTAGRRVLAPRELSAWTIAGLAVVALALVVPRLGEAPDPGVPVVFEMKLPEGMDLTPVGNQATLALDRDGTTLVFQARDSGSQEPALFVRQLDEVEVQRIRGTEDARGPILSPDGADVLFMPRPTAGGSPASGKRVSVRGGTPRTFIDSTANNSQVSWVDGSPIVLAFRDALWTMPPEGGARTVLTRPDTSRGHVVLGFPSLLPGGRAALISIWKGDFALDSIVLGVVTIPDGKVTELGIRGTYPRYSPTGHLLYATSDGWLFAAPFSAKSLRVTGPAFSLVEGIRVGSGGAASLAVSDNGILAYLGGDAESGTSSLFAVSRGGVERSLGAAPGFYSNPRVSPDGGQIALTVATGGDRGSPRPDIWRLDTLSKVLSRVTTDSMSFRPAWSRDGERLAYIALAESIAVWRPLYAAGKAVELARATGGVFSISLGPAHGYAAFTVGGGAGAPSDIWLVHQDSLDKPRPFLDQPYSERSPAVSADGRLLAYVSDRTGRSEVYVQSIPRGGDEVRVSADGAQEPVWSRPGRELFFRGPTHLMAARLADGVRVQVLRPDTLFRDTFSRSALANYDVFPGGREFVMVRRGGGRQAYPLLVMMNWHKRGRAAGPAQR